jgi:hypothetical protein
MPDHAGQSVIPADELDQAVGEVGARAVELDDSDGLAIERVERLHSSRTRLRKPTDRTDDVHALLLNRRSHA